MKVKPIPLLKLAKEVVRLGTRYPNAVYDLKQEHASSHIAGKVYLGPRRHGCLLGQAIVNCSPDPKATKALFRKAERGRWPSDMTLRTLPVKMGLIEYPRKHDKDGRGLFQALETTQTIQDDYNAWGDCIPPLKTYLNNRLKGPLTKNRR